MLQKTGSFNSNVVRVRVEELLVYIQDVLFQFQCGAGESGAYLEVKTAYTTFQFQCGAGEREDATDDPNIETSFQFQCGAGESKRCA